MLTISEIINKGFQIVLINLVLSVDNVGLIAFAIKDLTPKKAKLANIIGISTALILRIFFVGIIGFLCRIQWLPINLIGGIILLYITLNMAGEQEKIITNPNEKYGFKDTVFSIILADITMSLDNVLAMTSIVSADGKNLNGQEIGLLVFGLLICIPIIFFGSDRVSKLMQKYILATYICSGLLAFFGVKMICKDRMISSIMNQINPNLSLVISISCGVMIIILGAIRALREYYEH